MPGCLISAWANQGLVLITRMVKFQMKTHSSFPFQNLAVQENKTTRKPIYDEWLATLD